MVHVSDARNRPVADAVVRVLAGQDETCDFELFTGKTLANGVVHVGAPVCGDDLLLVTKLNLPPYRRLLDTCDVKWVDVKLEAAPDESQPVDPCVAVAREFTRAYWARAAAVARSLLTSESKPVDDPIAGEAYLVPWYILWHAPTIAGDVCTASATLTFENSCQQNWPVRLQREHEGWRVSDYR